MPGLAGEHPPSLAASNRLRATYPQARIAASVSPCIQWDLKRELPVPGQGKGTFKLNFREEFNFDFQGLTGTIEFTPAEDARDSNDIGLLQTARVVTFEGGDPADADWEEPQGWGQSRWSGLLLHVTV